MPGEGERVAMEIGPGDFVKLTGNRGYRQVSGNSCFGVNRPPREGWTISTTDGGHYGMYDISRYFKQGDKDLFKY